MPDQGTSKKLTKVGGDVSPQSGSSESKPFVVNDESRGKAKSLRLFAILSWIAAIGFEVGAILMLKRPPVNTTGLIVLIAADLIFAVVGSLLWKKSNRLDPASEKERFKFFIQNQLGALISIIAFLPLVILILADKNLDKKQKGLFGAIAVIAMLVAGITGIDFNPPSVEKYAEQTAKVESLNNGVNHVFWTKSGRSYHLYSDCSYINTDRTTEIFEGTVTQARDLKNITDLCDRCGKRAIKEKGLDPKLAESVEQNK
jgi:hypothetical protein